VAQALSLAAPAIVPALGWCPPPPKFNGYLFRLKYPDHERLKADTLKGSVDTFEKISCPITWDHLDGYRRTSELAVQVKHNRRNEMMIWTWLSECLIHRELIEGFRQRGITGYRLRPAIVDFAMGTSPMIIPS